MVTQLHQLVRYREAIRNLTLRDLRVRYSNTVIGVAWSLLNPLALTLVFSIIFVVMLPSGIPNYPVFFLAGLLPWNFFSTSLLGAVASISGNSHLINRVYFPREVLPISIVLSNAIAFGISLVPLAILMAVFQVPLRPAALWLPALVVIQIVFNVGLGLLLSAVNVFLRDTQQIVEVLMLPWFFLTPIIYPAEQIASPSLQLAMLLINPMASLVTAYRQSLVAGLTPDLLVLGVTAAEALALLLLGLVVFRRLSPLFADEL